jgi:hypothetical protein
MAFSAESAVRTRPAMASLSKEALMNSSESLILKTEDLSKTVLAHGWGIESQYVFVDSVKFLQIFCKLPKIDYSSLYILKKTMKRQKKMVLLG